MIMPNIGAFIAWGLLTAMFIPAGWFPNESLAKIVTPALNYLLPILIAYTAGKNIAGDRGGVTGAIAVIGIIAGSEIPMFIGAMIMGPLGGAAIKWFDKAVAGKVRSGFEMLVNNFSIGIIGMLLALIGFGFIGGTVEGLTALLGNAAQYVISKGLLPIVSIVVEPAKVLFLNNAINHGIFSPVGIEQVAEAGRSVMFLIEANPGAGLGVLLAYWIAGKGDFKSSAPGAAIIHFLGGIHEIYFPYVLAKPALLLAMIGGSACSLLFFSMTGAGLVAPASPGSIISVLAMAPKGQTFIVLLGVLIATAVSLLIALPIIKGSREIKPVVAPKANDTEELAAENIALTNGHKKIMFCCDAGMGSSALAATRFRKRVGTAGVDATVANCAIDELPGDTDIAVCQNSLKDRAKLRIETNVKAGGRNTLLISIDNFMEDPALDRLLASLRLKEASDVKAEKPVDGEIAGTAESEGKTSDIDDKTETQEVDIERNSQNENVQSEAGNASQILSIDNILTSLPSESKEEAILRAGHLLESKGYTAKGYAEAMLERESLSTTYIGMGIAIPHGTDEAKKNIARSGIVVLQYPEGVDFGEEKAQIVVGIAGVGDDHLSILASLSEVLEDEDKLNVMMTTKDPKDIYRLLSPAMPSADGAEEQQ